jgi:hypothetical protein
MIETRSETATEQRLDAVKGHSSGFMRGLVGGTLLGTAAGVLFAPQMPQRSATFAAI